MYFTNGLYYARLNYLLPKWYGKKGEWMTFAREAADSRGTEGDKLYAWLIWRAAIQDGEPLYDSNANISIDWSKARAGFELLLKEYPDSIDVREAYSRIALLTGHLDLVGSAFANWSLAGKSTN